MATINKPSGAARTATLYITVGALIAVWTTIYWIYLTRHPEGHSDTAYYWVYGFFFTGVVLLIIGMALGHIGRAARHAEFPPDDSSQPTSKVPLAVMVPDPMNGLPGTNDAQLQSPPVPGQVIGAIKK